MKTIKILGITLLAISLITLNSCEKASEEVDKHEDDYPHSSVKSTEITVNSYDWSGDGNGFFVATKSVSIITSDIAQNGAVLCYMKGDGQYLQMPLTLSDGQDSWTRHYIFTYGTGTITFVIYDDDGLTPEPKGQSVFKVVTMENYAEAKSLGLDFKNYEEVQRTFNLE